MPRFQPHKPPEKHLKHITVHMSDSLWAEIRALSEALEYGTFNLFYLHLIEEGLVVARREVAKRKTK